MSKEFRLIIAGGRDFFDFNMLIEKCDKILCNVIKDDDYDITIISGGAKGADALGEKYCLGRGFDLEEFPADWDRHGKKAGFLRNQEMADYALQANKYGAVIFWNGESKGSKHMIDVCENKKIPFRIIRY